MAYLSECFNRDEKYSTQKILRYAVSRTTLENVTETVLFPLYKRRVKNNVAPILTLVPVIIRARYTQNYWYGSSYYDDN